MEITRGNPFPCITVVFTKPGSRQPAIISTRIFGSKRGAFAYFDMCSTQNHKHEGP